MNAIAKNIMDYMKRVYDELRHFDDMYYLSWKNHR